MNSFNSHQPQVAFAIRLLIALLLFTELRSAPALTYSEWAATQFTLEEMGNATISGPTADPDTDGWSNLYEYAISGGLAKTHQGQLSGRLQVRRVTDNAWRGRGQIRGQDSHYLEVEYTPRAGVTDLEIRLELSTNLTGWMWGPSTWRVTQTSPSIIARAKRRQWLDGEGTRQFARLRIMLTE